MRRISSLPTAEFCPRVDKIGLEVETTNSARGTMFHHFAATGKWPADFMTLPEADRDEIGKWMVPAPFVYKVGDVTHALRYATAIKEERVALDANFKTVDVPRDIPQSEIAAAYPQVMIVGHLDMAWVLPEHDLVIVCDIKSSIFAVREKTDSLQLHGYGIGLAAKTGMGRYLTSIWDASDGRYHVAPEAVEVDSFVMGSIQDRIRLAASERDGDFRTGTHCSGCWKKSHCPAHLVDVPEGEFQAILSGQATEAQVREAIIKAKQIQDLHKRVDEACKDWVRQHGPVRSEDGKRVYQCSIRKGKAGLDHKAVMAALQVESLDDYMRPSQGHPAFEWRKKE